MADYTQSPASAFLRQLVEANNTYDYCKRKFKTSDGKLHEEAKENLELVTLSLVASAMGHFETFQKSLFAGSVEVSRFFKDFHVEAFCNQLRNGYSIKPNNILAFRGNSAQVGSIIADHLGEWHNPATVSEYFKLFGNDFNFYSNKDIATLRFLWQVRHTIVHTGGWLTLPDAQKVKSLTDKGDRALAFEDRFIYAMVKKLHNLVRSCVNRLDKETRKRLRPNITTVERDEFNEMMKVESTSPTFFR